MPSLKRLHLPLLDGGDGMRRLKVLFVTAWYPTREQPVGGVFVREHAKAVQLYDDVLVLHLAGAKSGVKGLWELEQEQDPTLTDGLTTYRLWVKRSAIPKTSYLITILALPCAVRRLVAAGFRPEIIHAHVYTAAAAAAPVARFYRVPMVVTEHWSGFPRRLLRPFDICRARLGFQGARMVMPVSYALQRAIESYGIRVPFQVVPNVVNVDLFHPSDRTNHDGQIKRLLFVGLLDFSHVKGVPYLLQALSSLKHQRDDWHLDIVGDGPARFEYERMAQNLGIQDKVTFHGLKSKSEVADFMRQADIFVLPSIWENLPCVLIEAMASGLPIVTTAVGGIPEIMDDDVGIVVPPRDAVSLSNALARMLDDVDRYDRFKIASKATRYSPHAVGATIDAVYRAVVGTPTGPYG